MEIASFLKLLSQTDGFGFGIFVSGCFSQFINFVFLCCLLLLGLKFIFFKGTSFFVEYLEKIYRISPKNECCNSFDREHKACFDNTNNGFISKSKLVDGLDQKKPIILQWSTVSADRMSLRKSCDHLLLRDGIDLSKTMSDITVALSETELDEMHNHGEEEGSEDEEESRSRSDEDKMLDVITLRKLVKRERKRGDRMKLELEKERRAAESAAEEAMSMLLKLRMEKSDVEMEANQYRRVAEQKQVYDQEVIQSLQWMLMKLDDQEKIQDQLF